jgi:hypothetical protein
MKRVSPSPVRHPNTATPRHRVIATPRHRLTTAGLLPSPSSSNLCSLLSRRSRAVAVLISQIWFLPMVAALFVISQLAALSVTSVEHLWVVSTLLGGSYGSLFNVVPMLVLEWFGMSTCGFCESQRTLTCYFLV